MTYIFTLPRSFAPAEFLSRRLLLYADSARWLVSTITYKTANRDTDPWGCVRLDSRILRRVMGNHAKGVIGCLQQGAIEISPYCVGVKCKGYRLAKRYLGDRCLRVPAVDPGLLHRLAEERQRRDAEESKTRWQPIHYALDAEQRRLSIDVAEAEAILESLPGHCRLCQDVLVSHLCHREFPFSISTTGRVFNAITGLKRELRHTLRIGGEPLGSVDICCAQPALLALEMARNTPTNGLKGRATYKHTLPVPRPLCPLPSLPSPPLAAAAAGPSPSLDAFASLVACGRLYERLMDLSGLDRPSVKLAFLRDVLAKRGRYPSFVERTFRREFPDVYAFIHAVNGNDHAELIRRLQRLESWLVIEQVAPRLVGRVPVITLHDAIYSTCGCLARVEEAFADVFDAIDFRLTLKREAG